MTRPSTAPRVSVVVPVFNGQDFIADCLDSLLQLAYPRDELEIVVVNNASTDTTSEILERYAGRISQFHESVRGPAAARNRGIREAAGTIVAFTDADCTVETNWLGHLIEPLADATVGIAGGAILARRPANPVEMFGETIHDHRKAIEVFSPPYVITMNWASRREVLLDAGLFDETYMRCEDVDLSQRIAQRGYALVYREDAIIYHRNESSLAGLWQEGFQHGVWAVKHNKLNHEINRRIGHRRFNLHSYSEIGVNLWTAMSSRNGKMPLCQATFDFGKKIGKLAGSVRFGYVDL